MTLTTNTVYYWKANSRNYYGLLNSSAAFDGKCTLARPPATAEVSTSAATNTLKINVYNGNNPGDTELAIAVSSDNFVSDTRYVYSDTGYKLRQTESWWDTWDDLGQFTIEGLGANTTYYVKVKAQNGDEAETGFSSVSSKATRTTVPSGVFAVGQSSSMIQISWSGDGAEYFVQWSTAEAGTYNNLLSDWITADTTEQVNLTPNLERWYKVKARNHAEIETASCAAVQGYTQSIVPAADTPWVDNVFKSSAVIHWVNNGNAPGTNYQAVVSTNFDFAPALSTTSFNADMFITTFTALSSNTSYYFRVRSSGTAGVASNWCVLGSTWTLIPQITNSEFQIETSSIGIKSDDSFNNLSGGNSGLRYYCYADSNYSEWKASSTWLKNQDFWYAEGLNKNATYYFKLKSRNGSGIDTVALAASTATAIETVESLQFTVYASSIGAAAFNTEGFSILTAGDSGIECWSVTESTGSLWRQTTNHWWFDHWGAGLTPGGEYTFKARSRNNKKNTNGWSAEMTTHTLCNAPLVSSIELVTDYEDSKIKVVLNKNGNDDIVRYAIAASSGLSWGTTRYVQATGILGDSESWKTYSEWGGTSGTTTINLASNEVWSFKIKAKNGNNVETDFSAALTTATYIQKPTGMTFNVVGSTYVRITPQETFSNPASGQSGIKIYTLSGSTDGGWRQNAEEVYLSDPLTPNTTHDFKIKVRNRYGNEYDEGTYYYEEEKLTLAAMPGYKAGAVQSTGSAKCEWTENSNDSNTEYLVVASTANDYSVYNSNSGWFDPEVSAEYTFGDLNANIKYYFGVKARNFAYEETDWRVLDSSYTKIQNVVNSEWEIANSSIEITAVADGGSFSNLGDDDAAVRFFCYINAAYDEWKSSTPWTTDTSTEMVSMTANTTYYFEAVSRNGDAAPTSSYQKPKASRIETVGSLQFTVDDSDAIQVAPVNTFTEIDAGASGIYYTETTTDAVSLWRNTTNWWTLSGLDPNKQYTFKAKTRNRAALENGYSGEYSTYTRANVPLSPTLSNPTTYSVNIVIRENDNPAETEFAVMVSSDNWATTNWVGADNKLTADKGNAAWMNKAGWGGAINGTDIIGLTANRQYKVKIKARNQCGIETVSEPEAIKYTLIESAGGMDFPLVSCDSVEVQAAGSFTTNPGDPWIQFLEGTANSSAWFLSNGHTFPDLSTNEVYNFKVRTQNSDSPATANDWTTAYQKATRIETPTGVEFDTETVTYNSIRAKVTGTFTNLEQGQSAVNVYCNNVAISSGVWVSTTSYREFTGLLPNVTYYFVANSRNQQGVLNSSSAVYGIHTLCVVPSSPTIKEKDKDYLKIAINSTGTDPQNPDADTEYVIAVSTVNAGFTAGTTYYMESADGPWGVSEVWNTYTGWNGLTGSYLRSLDLNTRYWFKVKAKNKDGVETAYGNTADCYTLGNAPDPLVASAVSTTTINLSWENTASEYYVEYTTSSVSPYTWYNLYEAGWKVMLSTEHAGLSPNVYRKYRVEGKNAEGTPTGNSTAESAVTWTNPPVAGAYTDVSKNSITGNWTDGSNPSTTKYYCEVSSDNFVSYVENSGAPEDISSFNPDTLLKPNTEYNFRVRSCNSDDSHESDYTELGSTYTLCEVPAAPTCAAASASEMQVTINDINNPAGWTKYAIKALHWGATSYVQADMTLGGNATYYTLADWDGITVTDLSANNSYWWSVSALNGNGVVTAFGGETKKYTKANVPARTGNWDIYLSSVTVNWGENENPDSTLYRVECDTFPQFGSPDGYEVAYTSYTFTFLDKNLLHYFQVKAKDGNGDYTNYVTLGSSSTKIETVESSSFTVHQDEIGIKGVAVGEIFSNPGTGNSGLYYEIQTPTGGVVGSSWTKSTDYCWFSSLSKNTSYYFVTNSRNYDGVLNTQTSPEKKSTLIEMPTALNFISVSTYSITAQPQNEFSNLTSTYSGVMMRRGTTLDTSGWRGSTVSWICDDEGAGLEPSKGYSFQIRSRNLDSEENGYVTGFSTWTLAEEPGYWAFDAGEITTSSIKSEWTTADNNTAQYYCEASTSATREPVFLNSGWLADNTTCYFFNLESNVTYYFQVKAKNGAGIETAYRDLGDYATRISSVTGISFDEIKITTITVSGFGAPFANLDKGASGLTFTRCDEFGSPNDNSNWITDNTWEATGLTPNTTYWFKGNSRNVGATANSETQYEDYFVATKAAEAGGLSYSTITSTSVKVTWGASTPVNNPPDTLYRVELATSSNFGGVLKSSSTSRLTATATVPGLSENVTYYCRVKTINRVDLETTVDFGTKVTLTKARPVDNLTTLSGELIRVSFSGGTNPSETLYAIKVEDGATEYLNSSNNLLTGIADYQTLATWGSYRDVGGLTGNTTYAFSIVGKNWEGATNEGAVSAKATDANAPGVNTFEDVNISTYSVRPRWTANGNKTGTEFVVEVSTASTFSVIKASYTTPTLYKDVAGLDANSGYYFQVAAKNLDGDLTAFTDLTTLGAKYTRLELPVMNFGAFTSNSTQIDISAQTFSNITTGDSDLRFIEEGSDGTWSSAWGSNKSWTRQENNPAGAPALTANTTYLWTIQSKNAENLPNSDVTQVKATRIEQVVNSQWEIASSSIGVMTTDTLSNLANGSGGIYYEIQDSNYAKINSTWTKSAGYYWFEGLSADTTYYFIANSRNYDGIDNSSTSAQMKHTYCVKPATPTVAPAVTGGDTKIAFTLLADSNQNYTKYAIAVSSDAGFSPMLKYAQADYTLGDSEGWIKKTLLYPGGQDIAGLQSNTLYHFKVKARNIDNVVTEFSGVVSTYTDTGVPGNPVVTAVSTTTLKIEWTGTATEYQVEYSTTNSPAYQWQQLTGWLTENTTEQYNLTPNLQRWYKVRGKNEVGQESVYSGAGDGYTKSNPPSVSGFGDVQKEQITVTWGENSNPSDVDYLVCVSSAGVEISTKESHGWSKFADINKTFASLGKNVNYYLWAYSKNSAGITSNFTNLGSTYTLCEVPAAPTCVAVSATEMQVTINDINNPAGETKYAIKVIQPNATNYVQADMTLGVNATYYTLADWDGITVTELTANNSYWWSVAAMNGNGVVTAFGAETKKYTQANVPAVTGNWGIYLSSVTVDWGENNNPSGTEYKVERGTSSDFGGTKDPSDWVTYSSHTFTLDKNMLYWFRVQARNSEDNVGDRIPTDYMTLGSSSTRIESVKNDTSGWEVYYTSMNVTAKSDAALEEFTNLETGASGVNFSFYKDSGYSQLYSSSNWIHSAVWSPSGLSQNTSYYLSVNSRNRDGVANGVISLGSKATRMEDATGLNFVAVSTYTITLQPLEDYSNMGFGQSAVEMYRTDSDNSGWQATTAVWVSSNTGSGLTPGSEYEFKIKSRNQDGTENGYVTGFSTWTWANPPKTYAYGSSVEDKGLNYIKVRWDENNNSNAADYWVEGSRDSYGGQISTGVLSANTTYCFLNLLPNVSYYIQVKAINGAGISSDFAQLGSSWTWIEPVTDIIFDDIYESSITFSAFRVEGGTFSNMGAGLSGVKLGVYKDASYSDVKAETEYSAEISTTTMGLTPNTTYYFTANSRNGEGTGEEEIDRGKIDDEIPKVTRIQKAQGVQFGTITNTTLKVRPEGVDTFDSLAEGLSGAISSCTTMGTNSLWAQTTDYWILTGLNPNTTYTFKSNSRNRVGLENAVTVEVSTMTAASQPQALPFTNVSLSGIRANWNTGSPANPDGTEYYIEASSVSSEGPFGYHNGWQTVLYRDFEGLTANSKYYFRVRAKNKRGVATDWLDMGAKYTLIEQITDANYTVNRTSITISAQPSPTGLDRANSGIIFTNVTTDINSGWITNNTYAFGAEQALPLQANTTYQFRVNTKNGDGTDNAPYDVGVRATRIETVSGSEFAVGSSSIGIKTTDGMTKLANGGSAIWYGCYSNSNYTGEMGSSWTKNTTLWWADSLDVNTTYYWKANSRNYDGILNSSAALGGKCTRAAVPSAPEVSTTVVNTELEVKINLNSNPDYTEFAILITDDINWTTTNYAQNYDSAYGAGIVWKTKNGWYDDGAEASCKITELNTATTYYVKIMARNLSGTETIPGVQSEKLTPSDVPTGLSVVPATGSETNQITVSWSGNGVAYWVQYSTKDPNVYPADIHDLTGWITVSSTEPAGLEANKKYYYRVKSKNSEDVISAYCTEESTWTWAECPGALEPTPIFVSSMTANWGTGGNPSTTEYYVECSTMDAFTGGDDKNHDWDAVNSYKFTSLAANTKYYYRAKSRTSDDWPNQCAGTWTVLNPTGKYTLIENPTAYWLMTGINSITVKAAKNNDGDSLSNLGVGGTQVHIFGQYQDPGWLPSNDDYTFTTSINPNTTYWFKVAAKNGDGTVTADQGPFIKATKIEMPSGLDFFDVRTTTVAVKCIVDNFTNLGVSSSSFKMRKAGYGWSEWFKSEDSSHTLTGLTPSSPVDFEIVSKNRENIANEAVTFSTYTRAQVSEIESVEGLWNSDKNYHTKITIDTTYNDNLTGPDGVQFAVYKTVDNKYINPNTWVLTDLDDSYDLVWATSTLWYHKNLSANTGCGYKIKARNQCDIKTDFSGIKIGTTPVAAPLNMTHTANDELSDGVFTLQADCDNVADAGYYLFYVSIATGGWSGDPTKTGVSDHQFSDLSANTKYEYYAAASKYIEDETFGAPSVSTESYTAIEAVLSNEWNIGSDSTTIIAKSVNGGFNNIEADLSGLRFYAYENDGYSIFHSSSAWIKAESYQFTGLSPNTSYFIKVQSRNGDADLAISPATGLTYYSTMTWTGAEIPAAPVLSEASNNSIKVTLSSGTNPEWTLYAICNTLGTANTVGKYLTAGGSLQTGATWYTFADFGGEGGVFNSGLESNKSYAYKVMAKNAVGRETAWSDDSAAIDTTGANPPGSANYSNLEQGSLTANWTNSNNPSGTKYLTQISTTADYSVVLSSSEWLTAIFSHEFTGLSANSKYYCKVCAKDATDAMTAWTELGSIYTLIESPTGIVWEATDENYITVKVTGTLSNLSASFSGILFEELVTGENPGDYIKKKFWTLSSLTPNTTYAFRITARNGDGESGEAAGPFVRATLMEGATGMTFVEVSSKTIIAQAAGTFTNPSVDSSAVKIYETQTSTDSGWAAYDSQFAIEGLKANTSYYFYTISRNREGTEGIEAAGSVKYTYAAVPSTPTTEAGSSPSEGNYIDVTPGIDDNPSGTEYLLDIAEDSGFTVIVSSDRLTVGVLRFAALESNTTYYVRSRARNAEGEITGYGPQTQVVTCPSSPAGFTNVSETYYSIKWEWNEVAGAATYNLYSSVEDFEYLDIPEWEQTSLNSNTSYWAYATAVGATGEGGASDIATAYTLIETPDGVGFGTINSTSIKVNTVGSFTAMGAGESAVRVGRFSDGDLISGTTSTWRQPSDYYEFTELSPNKEYYFKSQAKNIPGSMTPWSADSIEMSTYTYAETPLAPSLSDPTTYSMKVTIDRGNNPIETEYSIYCNQAAKYVQADGSLSDAEFWQEYNDGLGGAWGGSGGKKVTGLTKDNGYTFKLNARNFPKIETGWGADSEEGITTPSSVIINCVDRAENVWIKLSTASFSVSGSDHYHWIFTQSASDSAATGDTEWNGSTMTLTMTAQGDWFLHVRGENGAGGFLGADSFGPIRFDDSAPLISALSCYYNVSMTTAIADGEWTSESTPYFVWDEPASTAPVSGYSISWAMDSEAEAGGTVTTNLRKYEPSCAVSGVYYLKVRALDEAGNWGGSQSFVYKYAQEGEAPEVETVDVGGEELDGSYVGVASDITPAVSFSRDIDPATIENKIVMRAVRNNYGEKGLWEVSGTAVYDNATKKVIFTPSMELLKNYSYELVINEGIKDVLGNEISSATVRTFTTLMDPGVYNAFVGSDEKTKVKIEAGAVAEDSYVTISSGSAGKEAGISAANAKLTDNYQYPLTGGGRDFNIYNATGTKLTDNFAAQVEIEIPYTDNDSDGIVDGSSPQVKVETLAIYYLNEVTNTWEKLASSRLDELNKKALARVEHFSYYTIMGVAMTGVADAYAYPVPWRPGDIPDILTSGTVEGIKFAVLASDCVIKIYTISGQKVTEVIKSGGADPVWDVTTEGGSPVASGVYIYVVEGGGGTKTGKLIIIR